MQPGEPSRTAILSAVARYAHAELFDGDNLHTDDYALRLSAFPSGESIRELLETGDFPEIARVCAYFGLRQRFFEECLVAALQDRVEQVLLLGAGLDSFGLRHPKIVERLAWFEVDHPDTQRWKRERIRELALPEPTVRYVPVDFESQRLEAELARAGFDAGARTCASWLGVTQYIEPAATSATLEWFRALPAGSEIVFDFVLADTEVDAADRALSRAYAERSAQSGEPWVAAYAPWDLEDRLFQLGFQEVERLTPEMAVRYYLGQPDSITPISAWQLIRARVG